MLPKLYIYFIMGFENIIYILKHKWYYFLEAMKMGLYISAFTHDLSKFYPIEYIGYIIKFCMPKYCPDLIQPHYNKKWEKAYKHHIKHNKHHWNHWLNKGDYPIPMPLTYVRQMICDWQAMGRVFGDDAIEFYKKNRKNMILHRRTEVLIVTLLEFYYNNRKNIWNQ